MPAPHSYPEAVRRRAVAEVIERGRKPADVARDLPMTATTLANWVRQEQRDRGLAPGATSEQLARFKELEKQVAELKRTNEILKAATSFFAKEADHTRTK